MKTYSLFQKQFLPISLNEAWEFFSSPKNLKKITPGYMGFEITSDLGDGKMFNGQKVAYIVKPVLGIPMKWVSEIKEIEPPYQFVDEQLSGPYKYWYHKHLFKEVEGGVEMTDEITYALPFGPLGQIANHFFVRKQLNEIFNYRKKVIETIFPVLAAT